MIGWLQGSIIDKLPPSKLILNVNGVGYLLEIPSATFFKIEGKVSALSFYVHTVLREDSLTLFGFLEKNEKELFQWLIKTNGIGPKMALNILSALEPQSFIQAIQNKDSLALTRLPGIGKKTAERLIIDMQDHLKHLPKAYLQTSSLSPSGEAIRSDELGRGHSSEQAAAISALENLGYKPQEAAAMIRKVDDGQKNCEQLIRQALQLLIKA